MSPVRPACRDALHVFLGGTELRSVDALERARVHAAACPHCASALDDPDASRRVLVGLAQRRPRPRISAALRSALVVLAVAQLVVACGWLFGDSIVPDRHVALDHLTRDGALDLAVACAGLVVAWRARYALVAALVGSVVFAAQFATGLVDHHDHHVNTGFELTHLLAVAVLAIVVFTALAARFDTPRARRAPRLRSL